MQLCLFNQRWRERRESYRPAGEPINPRLYEIAKLTADREAKKFILRHHIWAHIRALDFGSGCSRKESWWASQSSAIPATTASSHRCSL